MAPHFVVFARSFFSDPAATPSPSPTAAHVARTGGSDLWSSVVPTWIGALATAGLLIGAILTVIFAVRAFNKQSREVVLLQEQLADQQKINQKQASVFDLQATELRESLAERQRESELRHRYQAVRVFPFLRTLGGEPVQYSIGIRNSSDLPVYNLLAALRWSWSGGASTLSLPEYLVPVLMPNDEVWVPSVRDGITCNTPTGSGPVWAQIWFRDAQQTHWTVTSKGEIVERPGPPLGTQGSPPVDLEPR